MNKVTNFFPTSIVLWSESVLLPTDTTKLLESIEQIDNLFYQIIFQKPNLEVKGS